MGGGSSFGSSFLKKFEVPWNISGRIIGNLKVAQESLKRIDTVGLIFAI